MKRYSIFCSALMASYYIIQVCVLGYTVYYLSSNSYSTFEIGILLSVFGIIAAIVQPVLGHIADRNKIIDFKNILICLSLIAIALFICLLTFNKNKLSIGIIFGIVYVLTNIMSPFVNESCFYYINNGINVNFGIVRGFGSLSFAALSYIVGFYTDIYGTKAVTFTGIIATIVFFLVALLIPRVESKNQDVRKQKNSFNASMNDKSHVNIIAKYPSFFLIVIATILAVCFQNADCGYLIEIIESLGGDASDYGNAIAIAAIVELPIMFSMTKIVKKIKVKKLIVIACGFYILRGLVFLIPSMVAIYIAQVLQMFSYAIIISATVYLSDETMNEEDKNIGQTFIGMAVTIGLILGSFIGGELLSNGGVVMLEVGCIFIACLSFVFAIVGSKLNA